ncbi:McrB family protein [Limosilactobacillus mucosae]
MKIYISENDVQNSIEYFKNGNFEKDDSLGIYLMLKHLGISTESNIALDTKNPELQNALDIIAKITDNNEKYTYGSYMIPFCFSKSEYYQKATKFGHLLGRLRDTIKQKNSKIPLYDMDLSSRPATLKLKSNYKDILQTKYLLNNKISLKQLAAWAFRFNEFEFDKLPSKAEFSRVVRKYAIHYFHFTKQEQAWFYDDDLQVSLIEPSKTHISGLGIRKRLGIDESIKSISADQEYTSLDPSERYPVPSVSRSMIKQYSALIGDNPSEDTILNTLKLKKQIILTGVPGTGKSRYTRKLSEDPFFKKSDTVQFHANYTYEEFIGGTSLENTSDSSSMIVVSKEGALLKIMQDAVKDPDNNYLLVIDEINRGNIAAILGETILALDRNYTVDLSKPIKSINKLHLPDNLYIVGTMNTSDRNIAFLDLAIRRRFAFINLVPNYDFLSEKVNFNFSYLNKDYDFNLGAILRVINNRIYEQLKDSSKLLGQSYFIPQPSQTKEYNWDSDLFQDQFNFVILPTLQEYEFQKNGITTSVVGNNLSDVILDKAEFYRAFIDQFSELVR